jgi:hypothetical protein
VGGINSAVHHNNGVTHQNIGSAAHLPNDTVLDKFAQCKPAKDDFIAES